VIADARQSCGPIGVPTNGTRWDVPSTSIETALPNRAGNPRRPTPVPRHDRIVQVVVGLHERVRAGVLSADRERVARIERKSEADEAATETVTTSMP